MKGRLAPTDPAHYTPHNMSYVGGKGVRARPFF